MKEELKEELTHLLSRPVKWDCSLREYTSFRIGGPAVALTAVVNVEELQDVLQFAQLHNIPFRIIGRGTNLLVRDQGYSGIAILLAGEFKQYTLGRSADAIFLEAGAGCSLTRLSVLCMEKGIAGLEFAIGIPGSVGGAAAMNAGAWGVEIGDIVESIAVMTSQGIQQITRNEMRFEYRKMYLPSVEAIIVTSVKLRLVKGNTEEIRIRCTDYREQRLEKQPIGTANAGSIFKNPQGTSAGQLIDASGLKGMAIGDAVVSEKHANFIVNRGKARASEVLELIKYIQKKVKEDSGIELEPEVQII